MADDANPVAFLQRAHDRRADRHAADLFDFAARDRLSIGDQRQRFEQARANTATAAPATDATRHRLQRGRTWIRQPLATSISSMPRSRSPQRADREQSCSCSGVGRSRSSNRSSSCCVVTGRPAASSVASMMCLRSCSFMSDYRLPGASRLSPCAQRDSRFDVADVRAGWLHQAFRVPERFVATDPPFSERSVAAARHCRRLRDPHRPARSRPDAQAAPAPRRSPRPHRPHSAFHRRVSTPARRGVRTWIGA